MDFEGILLHPVYLNGQCSYCETNLADIACIQMKAGFEEKFICTLCLHKAFDALLGEKSELVSANVALELASAVDKLREDMADKANIEALHKRIEALEKNVVRKGGDAKKVDPVPKVRDEDQVRPPSPAG